MNSNFSSRPLVYRQNLHFPSTNIEKTLPHHTFIMAENVPDNYIPKYAQQDEWEDKELQKFAIEFYRISDMAEENERWVQSFTEDAKIQIGADKARGTKG